MNRRLPLAALVAALALTVTACSDDEPDDAGAPTSEPRSESSEPTEPTSTPTTDTPTPTETSEPPTEPSEPPSEPTSESPSPEPDPEAAPTTYAEAQARFDALGQEPQQVTAFETTTGIYCLLESDFVTGCELPQGAGIPSPGECDGPSQDVGRIEVDRGGPEAVCNTDTIREPGATRLELDSVAASPSGLQCLAEDIGVTCVDPAAEEGFFIGTGQYAVF